MKSNEKNRATWATFFRNHWLHLWLYKYTPYRFWFKYKLRKAIKQLDFHCQEERNCNMKSNEKNSVDPTNLMFVTAEEDKVVIPVKSNEPPNLIEFYQKSCLKCKYLDYATSTCSCCPGEYFCKKYDYAIGECAEDWLCDSWEKDDA